MNTTSRTIDLRGFPGDVSTWRDLGFLFLGEILDSDALARIRASLDDECDSEPNSSPYGTLRNDLWRHRSEFDELIRSSALVDPVLGVLGRPAARLFQDNLVWKRPGTLDRIEWHQDFSYWPLSNPSGATLWIALDDVDPGNGCMRYFPGTHLEGERRPADFFLGAGQPEREELAPIVVDEFDSRLLDVSMNAGEAVLHHPLLWHMSLPNRSKRERRAWSITFVDPGVRWDPEHAPHPHNFEMSPGAGDALDDDFFPVFSR